MLTPPLFVFVACRYNPHTTVPMSTNADQAVAAGWEFPPGRGTFSAALAANNNCVSHMLTADLLATFL